MPLRTIAAASRREATVFFFGPADERAARDTRSGVTPEVTLTEPLNDELAHDIAKHALVLRGGIRRLEANAGFAVNVLSAIAAMLLFSYVVAEVKTDRGELLFDFFERLLA
jgi:hypothetical protein